MKIFIKKGYIPIEANFTKPQVVKHDMFQDSFFDKTVDVTDEDKLPDAGELAAGFEFHVDLVGTEDELGFKKSVCTAKFSIKKVIRKNPFQTGVLFYKTKINTTRKLGWEFPAYNCKLSKILDAIPTCKIGR